MDYTAEIPKSVTVAWIKGQTEVSSILEKYMITLHQRLPELPGRQRYAQVRERFPSGYQILYLHWRFWSDVENGGFEQFLGNSTAVDNSGQVIIDTVAALQRTGLHNLAEWLQEAIIIAARRMPPLVLQGLPPEKRKAAEAQAAETLEDDESDERITGMIDPFDLKFNDLVNDQEFSCSSIIDEYVQRYPEEFVHSGWESSDST